MGASTTAGAKIYVGTTATDPLTDTYTAIGEVTSIGAFGRTYAEVTHTPLASRGVQKFKGSFNDGSLELEMADDSSDAGQALLQVALDDDFDRNFKVEANDDVAPASATVTMTIASPGVITDTAHGFLAGTPIKLSTTGALPTGLVAGTTYYVKNPSTNTYELAATVGGSSIVTSGTQSGVHTRTTIPAPTLKYMKAKVMAFPSAAMNSDSIMARTCTLGIKSGSTTTVARVPAA